jgi:hypothetical protein
MDKKLSCCKQQDSPFLERVMGIEPTLSAWEADILPLKYTRLIIYAKIILTYFKPYEKYYANISAIVPIDRIARNRLPFSCFVQICFLGS